MRFSKYQVAALEGIACCPVTVECRGFMGGPVLTKVIFHTEHGEFGWRIRVPDFLNNCDPRDQLVDTIVDAVLWFRSCLL